MENKTTANLIDDKYTFSDLIDIAELTEIFTKFTKASGFYVGLADNNTSEILVESGGDDICKSFHLTDEKACLVCEKNHELLFSNLEKVNKARIIQCELGLFDSAMPIFLENKHIANLFTGHLLTHKPDLSQFKNTAKEYGFNETEYLDTLSKVPIISKQKVTDMMDYLADFSKYLAEKGLEKLRAKAFHDELQVAKYNLEESETLFRTLSESSPIGVYLTDVNGKCTYANPKWLEIANMKLEEALGKGWEKAIHPEDKAWVSENWNKSVNSRGKWSYQYRFVSKNKITWVDGYANSMEDTKGKLIGFVGINNDITKQKEAEVQLIKAHEKATKYTEMILSSQSMASICSYSTNLNVNDINRSAWECSPECYNIFGIDESYPNTIAGWTRIIHPDYREKLKAYHEYVVKNKIPFNHEYKIIRINDGAERWVRGTGELVYDKDGNPIRMHGAIQDITEIKKTEDELIKAKEEAEVKEQQLKLIANNFVSGMIYQVASFRKGDRKFTYISDAVVKLYGCTPEEAIKDADLVYHKIHPDDIKLMKEKEALALQRMEIFNLDSRVINPDGSVRWSTFISKPRKVGKIIYWDGIEFDITEKVKMLDELKIAKEKAEESDRLKTLFINNMSHEIRTPMNGILGFSRFLENPNLSVDKRKEYIKILSNSGNQLLRIIDDIMEISRLGTKQVKLIEKQVCVNQLLQEQFSIFEIKAKERKLSFYLNKNLSDKESTVLTDETKLNKILSNLLENALKFTSEGFIELGYNLVKDKLEIYIKDTGIGISAENQKSIFKRFAQAKKEDSEFYDGLGLGLAIAMENAKLLGGDIKLQSAKGKGSTFFIKIPYKPNIVNALREEIKNEELNKSKAESVVLVAEDDNTNYLYLVALLENKSERNFKILWAKNGLEAVDILKKHSEINLILMDIKMPKLDGFEATKQIREFSPDIPIIAQTAYSSEEDRGRAISVGCNDFISKPISKETFDNIIKKHL